MLLRFAVSNHLSIKDKQGLSFVKSALNGPEEGLFSTSALPNDKILSTALIYGPNASGKSNLLGALMFMRRAVLSSHRKWEADGGVPRQYFRLNKFCAEAPSEFDIDFIVDDVRYNYGFKCTSSEFVEEWFYSAPEGRQRLIFERNGPTKDDIKFGPSFTGQKQAIAELMRPNSLFISAARQNNHDLAKIVTSFFQNIDANNLLAVNSLSLQHSLNSDSLNDKILSFLQEIGTGITSLKRVESEIPDEQMRTIMKLLDVIHSDSDAEASDKERKDILEMARKNVQIQFGHRSEDGEEVFFDSSMESDGTKRLIPLLKGAFTSLSEGSICVIDEIDSSLHTQICDAIIAMFTNKTTNPNGAQIIATTHDTNLFRASNLRRDELWLVEKSRDGASEIYSLADIKLRSTDNYERGYLQGRYGAVPFAGPASELIKTL